MIVFFIRRSKREIPSWSCFVKYRYACTATHVRTHTHTYTISTYTQSHTHTHTHTHTHKYIHITNVIMCTSTSTNKRILTLTCCGILSWTTCTREYICSYCCSIVVYTRVGVVLYWVHGLCTFPSLVLVLSHTLWKPVEWASEWVITHSYFSDIKLASLPRCYIIYRLEWVS